MKWKLLESIAIGGRMLRNRIVMPPMETRMSTIDGDVTPQMLDYYGERAKGGAGLIIVENTFVDNRASRSSLASSGFYSDHLIAGKHLLAERIQENGARAIIQLSHGGRQAKGGVTPFEPVAPSAVMCKVTNRMPIALTREEIIEIEDAFADAAFRAKEACFDGVEIHGAHGYLLNAFLSPRTNLREDEYGGTPANRRRFAANIARKIRDRVGSDFIVGYRITTHEHVPGGLEPEEACELIASLQDDLDYVNVTAGIYESESFCNVSSTYIPRGQLIPLARQMKKAVNIPVIAVGSFNPELAERTLQDGDADLIAFGRALLADPHMPNKLAAGREKAIRPCIRGNQGCLSGFYAGHPMRCEVNPACGREAEFRVGKTATPQKILVVGGGISGMEAARIAAAMGHQVTLLEMSSQLGGHLLEASNQEFKDGLSAYLNWLVDRLKESGATVLLNTPVTPALLAAEKPDAVVLAIGSEYLRARIAGSRNAMVADDVLKDHTLARGRVVVIGGGMIGAETALTLAMKGHEVTVLEMADKIAGDLEPTARDALLEQVSQNGITVLTGHTAMEIDAHSVKAKSRTGDLVSIDADSVVLAIGLIKRSTDELKGVIPNTICVGDCVATRKVFHCVHEAWHAVMELTFNKTIQ